MTNARQKCSHDIKYYVLHAQRMEFDLNTNTTIIQYKLPFKAL